MDSVLSNSGAPVKCETVWSDSSSTATNERLRDFFTNDPVRDFQVKHKGKSDGSEFCFGVLVTKNGSYRTKLYMKQKGDMQLLQEIGLQKLD